jgi:hypothetical protein
LTRGGNEAVATAGGGEALRFPLIKNNRHPRESGDPAFTCPKVESASLLA